MGSARMVAMSSSEIASRARKRRISAAETTSLDKRNSNVSIEPAQAGHAGKTRKIKPGFQHKLETGSIAHGWLDPRTRPSMIKKRNRKRPPLSFQERLSKFAQDARAAARILPPG